MPIQAPQWTDYLNCPVCCREFGVPPRSPISLSCGHTICKHCLAHLHRRQCPFDQTLIQVEPEELVVNTALLQLAGYAPPAQPYHPPCIQALPEQDRLAYDVIVRRLEDLATYLKYCGNANTSTVGGRLSRPMQRKLVTLVQCAIMDEEGRGRAARAARSLGERTVTELILQHQNPPQLSANLWAAVRARGCQFLGPAMQEEVLKLVLLALEDGFALSRKVLVMFVVQRLEPHFPQASKTSIGHVVQLLYRASCFKVSKRESDSSLMQLKEEFRTYESLRREHDAQIVQIATEAGLRIAPDLWSALLYGDTAHKSHMQSIIDKLQTPQSFAQSVQELFIALQRTGDPAQLVLMSAHFDRLSSIDASPDASSPSWQQLGDILTSLKEVVSGLIHYLQLQATGRDNNHNQKHSQLTDRATEPSTSQSSPQGGTTPTHGKYKVSMCRDTATRSYCPRGNACTFAHSEEELERYRTTPARRPPPPTPMFAAYSRDPTGSQHINNFNMTLMPPQPLPPISSDYPEQAHEGSSNFQQQNMLNGQLLNGMGLNQNGLMPMLDRPPATLHNLAYNNLPPFVIPLNQQIPPAASSQNFQGYQNQGLHGTNFPQQGLPMNNQALQNQVLQNQGLQNQSLQNQGMQGSLIPNMFVPIQPELKIPSRDLSPIPFDDLQSDILSDSYRAVTTGRFGPLPRTPHSWLPTNDVVFDFNNLSAALPTCGAAAEDVFGVGMDVSFQLQSANANVFNHPDDELEEEIQALERRLDKELDK